MNFLGEWKTEAGYYALVKTQFLNHWIGYLFIDGQTVPTYWDKNGNSIIHEFNLVQRRVGEEYWPISRVSITVPDITVEKPSRA